ncbi:hypothetical protein FB567DRAFT_217643 [Paraphoma chrysanthemicola]|uniref:NB-ARC domain-containing protein n=1 Tax=Paraphoma chrysanthemicola TaxID=798071 RepID=A0A8K0QT16_9PLEO|nr:hypothetical protein FB567DRAFT_217643 [Paraphoma chrysanthemicola]
MNDVISRCVPGSRLALTGIGGVGKSQIAIEFAHRVRIATPQMWVFWVDAKDAASVKASFTKIAGALHLPGWDEQNAEVFAMVKSWLVDESHGPWMMVVDSADDTSVLTAPVHKHQHTTASVDVASLPQLREFLPISRNGSVLITSTNSEAAHMLTGNFAHHVDLEEMTESEALALLKSKLHRKVVYTEDQATELVKAAECMPLAISQTAAHISADYPRFDLVKATEKLNNPGQDTSRLLEGSVHESNRDVRRTNSIVKSWHLNFQYVRERSPSAARLFSLMCLFDRQGIPEALLTGQYGEEATAAVARTKPHLSLWKRIRRRRLRRHSKRTMEPKDAAKDTRSSFDDDWRVLNSLMLIKTNLDGHHFNMHRLIQHTTQRWLEINGELKAWMRRYIALMVQHFPKPIHDNWRVCDYLYPHAQQVVHYRPSDEPTLRLWGPLIDAVARYAHSNGNYTVAERFGRLALEALVAIAGERNEVTLRCLQDLGMTLSVLGHRDEAESMYRRAWIGRQTLLGTDHLDALESGKSLGSILNSLGRNEEGEALHARVIESYERVFGPSHIETQSLLTNLSLAHIMNGRLEKGEKMYRRVQVIREDAFGVQSDDSYRNKRALAALSNLQGKHADAEAAHQEVVQFHIMKSGLHDAETIKSINFLCDALVKQNKLDDAVPWYRRIQDAYPDLDERARRPALESLDHLARAFSQLGRLEEAERVARHMIEEREKLLGMIDPDTALGHHTLAGILTQQEKFQPALDMYEVAYTRLKERSGAEHEDVIDFLNDLNAAKNRLLQWSGDENRVSMDGEEAKEKESTTAPIFAFQSPQPIALELRTA